MNNCLGTNMKFVSRIKEHEEEQEAKVEKEEKDNVDSEQQ